MVFGSQIVVSCGVGTSPATSVDVVSDRQQTYNFDVSSPIARTECSRYEPAETIGVRTRCELSGCDVALTSAFAGFNRLG